MRKSRFLKLSLILSVLAASALTSCSNDDNGTPDSELWKGELAAPAYASQAALYTIAGNAPVSSIELTGSGLYFVTLSTSSYNAAPRNIMKKSPARESSSAGQILSGVFRVQGSVIELDGFGSFTYDSSTGSLDITLTDGTNYVWDAAKQPQISSNDLNDRLCRTWRIKSARIEFLNSGKNVLGSVQLSSTQVEDAYISYFTFTRQGRMYTFDEGCWWGHYWQWSNSKSQIISLISDGDYDDSGVIQVFFDNDDMTIMQPIVFDSEEDARWEYDYLGITVPSGTVFAKEYLTCTNYTI